ncbi:MAG: HipA family kinase [Tumebacillaceae bacterium]
MAERRWRLKKAWKNKRQGQVWVVDEPNGRRGYFKFATKEQWFFSGPMIANEWIAAELAKRLGFPVAELDLTAVTGPDESRQRGLVSIEYPAKEILTWNEAGEEVWRHPEQHVHDIDLLASTVVFDAWIANIDRASGKNLVLYRHHPSEKYSWYLIDHGHALYGSPRKWKRGAWNAQIWQQLWRFYNVPKGLLRLQSSMTTLEPMIRRIEELREHDIDAAIRSVPAGHLGNKERVFIKRLLMNRQKQLRSIIERWLVYKGLKEYASE